ncbi:MAG TPA: 6,7-dimethyl-8-ribityllumazine synthase [Acidobacteriota bacterium]|nr:6,7-dimethyl-8-ribityllumazine synthase [Acidobacteriota bacterium]
MPEYMESVLSARGFRFAVIVSRYNALITERLLEGALEAFREGEVDSSDVDIYHVPGSFEIPQMARRAAETGRYDGIACLGALLRGETIHFELISRECARGIQEVAADFTLPVTFGVITADTLEQATARAGARSENKGWESARAAMELALLYRRLSVEEPAEPPGRSGR